MPRAGPLVKRWLDRRGPRGERCAGHHPQEVSVTAKPQVLEFGMGVDVHGRDATKAACRAVSDAIRHSSLPLFQEVRERGGKMLVDVTVGVPDPDSVKLDVVRRELPHGEVTVRAVSGGLRAGADTLIACVAITVSVDYPSEAR